MSRSLTTENVGGQRIVLVPPDPYLAFLVRTEFPDAEVVEDESADAEADLMIVDLDITSLPDHLGIPIIGIIDSGHARRSGAAHGVASVLLRPFLPQELFTLIARALGGNGSKARSRVAFGVRANWVGYLRLGAVSIAAVLETASGVPTFRAVLLGIAFLYAGLRLLPRIRDHRVLLILDVVVATLLLSATGGRESYYLGFGLVVALGSGMGLGWGWGIIAGSILSSSGLPELAAELDQGLATGSLTWVTLFPTLGLVGGLLSKLSDQDDPKTTALLAEANNVLSTLYSIARAMPGALEAGSATASALERLRTTLKSPAVGILIRDHGRFALSAAHGWSGELSGSETMDLVRSGERQFTILQDENVPLPMRDHGCWMLCPLGPASRRTGLLLAACTDHADHEINRAYVEHLSEELTVGLDNAYLFARVRELSVDGERRRLAGDLHDGVAQALAHVRFELDHLARPGLSEQEMRTQAERLSRVAARALGDVRMTISGLRDAGATEGLIPSLQGYLSDFRSPEGPSIELKVRGELKLSAIVEAELFRIVQEAVSNAVRHSMGNKVDVSVDATGMNTILRVQDDGVGISRSEPSSGGLGLRMMRERADRLGARLSIAPALQGGTVVEVIFASSPDKPMYPAHGSSRGRS